MQTFLPYDDFEATARALDRRRLGKQRVEVLQILNALTQPGRGWQNHPAVRMWHGYEEALARYGIEVCRVWCELGYADTCASKISAVLEERLGIGTVRTQLALRAAGALPPWLGDEQLHRAHRGSLLRKDPDHYGPLFDAADLAAPSDHRWPLQFRTGAGS